MLRKPYLVNMTDSVDKDFLRQLKKLEDRLFVIWNYKHNCFEIYRSCGLNLSKYILRCGTTLDYGEQRRILERLAKIDTRRAMQFDTFENNFKRFEEAEEASILNEERKDEIIMEDRVSMNANKMRDAMEALNFGSHMGREKSIPRRSNLCTAKRC